MKGESRTRRQEIRRDKAERKKRRREREKGLLLLLLSESMSDKYGRRENN